MRVLLASLQSPLTVQPSKHHDRNDCLTDSILLAMVDKQLIQPLELQERNLLCEIVRSYLVHDYGLSPCSDPYPFLSHDQHFHPICHILRQILGSKWIQKASHTSLTCVVLDRFNRAVMTDDGGMSEIPETNPVHSGAPEKESASFLITLYCNTDSNGDGWHYEWIRAEKDPSTTATYESAEAVPPPPPPIPVQQRRPRASHARSNTTYLGSIRPGERHTSNDACSGCMNLERQGLPSAY